METSVTNISQDLKSKIAEHRLTGAGRQKFKWPANIRLELLKAYAAGMSTTELESQSGINSSLIYKWAKDAAEKKAKDGTKKKLVEGFKQIKITPTERVVEKIASSGFRVRIGAAEVLGFVDTSSVVNFLAAAKLL